jgi:AI-2 transport protein TqsA
VERPSKPADISPGFGSPQIRSLIRQFSENLFSLLENAWKLVLGVIWNTIFVTIFVIFLLSGRNPRKVRSSLYRDIDQKIRRYIVTKLVVSAFTGLFVWFTLNHFGLELAVVFGILAFLLNFIPSIGSIISTFLPLPIAVAQFQGDVGTIVLVMLIPGVIQLVMGNVVEPKAMGGGLNLHPITILLALSFWGLLWGVVGMFLAAPITAVIRIVLMQFESLKPLAELLTGKLPFSSEHES